MTITLSNKEVTATINAKGAELISLISEGRNYIWSANPQFWNRHAPILFPIVGTLKDNAYIFENNKYILSRHGFARDATFEIIRQEEALAVFSLRSNAATIALYPFEFELQVFYSLEGKKLTIAYQISNLDQKTMPFSVGGHPAFALTEPFENYSLAFENDEKLNYHLLQDDLLSDRTKTIPLKNKKLPLNYKLFENDALVIKSMQSKAVTIIENEKPLLRINFESFPHFGIWTKQNAPFICLEPWHGYSDSVSSSQQIMKKTGMMHLKQNEVITKNYCIEIL